jgi:hypothetical protein
MTNIPLIIHQTWLDRSTDENLHPPKKYLTPQYTLGIAEMNPDFDYRFWNMRAAKELFRHPRLRRWKEFYFGLDDLIEQCDFLRYAILFIHGGVYIDCDLTAVRPLNTLVQSVEELMLVPNLTSCDVTLRHDQMTVPAAISNSVMGSAPNHHFWSELMDYIMYRYNKTTPVLYSTGPVAIGNFAQLMYYSIDDRPEWYISNRLVLWEEVPDSVNIEGRERPYLHNNRFMGSWWQLQPQMLYKTGLYYLRSSVVRIIIWIIVTLVLLIIAFRYYPPTQLGNLLECSLRAHWNPGTSRRLWLTLAGGALISGLGLIFTGVKCATKIDNQAEQWDILVQIGILVSAISLIVGSRSILVL